tara:strand:+ start:4018 stop:4182 length:165 start_codon:yes stop_codon:yes gene_type:complete
MHLRNKVENIKIVQQEEKVVAQQYVKNIASRFERSGFFLMQRSFEASSHRIADE